MCLFSLLETCLSCVAGGFGALDKNECGVKMSSGTSPKQPGVQADISHLFL